MNETILNRIEKLRQVMQKEHLSAFIIPSSDAHNSEYIPNYWKCREWISGFDGSAGTVVITLNEAALWTDSRYFIAAEEQLKGTNIVLMKDGLASTPSISEWLGDVLSNVHSPEVGINGTTSCNNEVEELKRSLQQKGGITLRTNFDPFNIIWTDRPSLPTEEIFIHSLEYAGIDCETKINHLQQYLKDNGRDGILVSQLDSIAWLLNLRGNDIPCNPVFVAYLLVTQNRTTLYINRCKLNNEVLAYLNEKHIETKEYNEIVPALSNYSEYNLQLDGNEISYTLYHAASKTKIVNQPSPIQSMKAIKNETEVNGFRNALKRDGVALVKFLIWLEKAVPKGGETELSIAHKLEQFRSVQPLYKGISFDTIAAYQAHGAIVHYEPTEETNVELKPEGFLLLDSGAQYLDGTTDITRTIPLGELTNEQKHVYTLVLKAHIGLAQTIFPEGTNGTQLDIMAREPLWKEGLNFGHGTGHGVGSFLNVHEGPQQIRMQYRPAPFFENTTITNEPGIYLQDKFGVRIENIMLATLYMHSDFGRFLQFESLTLCPIQTDPIKIQLLTNEELEWLNNYHKKVFQLLSPLLEPQEVAWLKEKTAPLTRS